MPRRCFTPGRKFSTTTSARSTSRKNTARPSSVVRSTDDRALVAVQVGAVGPERRERPAARWARQRDHLGAEVGELADAGGPGTRPGEVEHEDAGERPGDDVVGLGVAVHRRAGELDAVPARGLGRQPTAGGEAGDHHDEAEHHVRDRADDRRLRELPGAPGWADDAHRAARAAPLDGAGGRCDRRRVAALDQRLEVAEEQRRAQRGDQLAEDVVVEAAEHGVHDVIVRRGPVRCPSGPAQIPGFHTMRKRITIRSRLRSGADDADLLARAPASSAACGGGPPTGGGPGDISCMRTPISLHRRASARRARGRCRRRRAPPRATPTSGRTSQTESPSFASQHAKPKHEDRVDEVLADLRDREVRLVDPERLGAPARLHARLHLLAVEAVEEHRAEPDDGAQDVQHAGRSLVDRRSIRGEHHDAWHLLEAEPAHRTPHTRTRHGPVLQRAACACSSRTARSSTRVASARGCRPRRASCC